MKEQLKKADAPQQQQKEKERHAERREMFRERRFASRRMCSNRREEELPVQSPWRTEEEHRDPGDPSSDWLGRGKMMNRREAEMRVDRDGLNWA